MDESLRERLVNSQHTTARRGPKGCLELLSIKYPDDVDLLLEVFYMPGVYGSVKARELKAMGYTPISKDVVNRHVKGDCGCPPHLKREWSGA